MNQLIVKFNALDGDYTFICHIEDEISYSIDTNIDVLESKEGIFLKDEKERFLDKIKEARITSWDKQYSKTGLKIEDSVKWEVEYIFLDKTYKSKGEEGYWPYNFDSLIEALIIADDKAKYFLSNQN